MKALAVFVFLPLFSTALAYSSAAPCLAAILNLSVITPGEPAYVNASTPFNHRLHPKPSFITTPTSVEQIQEIVSCAHNSSLRVSAKSGGHSYAAYGLRGDVVINLSNLTNITVNTGDNTVKCQTGNRLGDLAEAIYENGQRALPHGSCPYVGVGGHTLYGGFGYFGRIGGLLLDTVVEAQVVLANGTLVTASNTSNPDLFWALRGGGPSFGVVTEWTYATLPAPPTVVSYNITFPTQLSNEELTSTFLAFQQVASQSPIPLAMAARFVVYQGGLTVWLFGDYFGTEDDFNTAIQPLIDSIPSSAVNNVTVTDWIGALDILSGIDNINTSAPDGFDTFYVKSLITNKPSSNASIASWVNYLASAGVASDTVWFAQADLYGAGGAINAVPQNSTAFAHRDAFLTYQLYASSGGSPPFPPDGIDFIAGMLHSLDPTPTAAYPNYIDPELSTPQWEYEYFNDHVPRLELVKREVDPNGIFTFREGF